MQSFDAKPHCPKTKRILVVDDEPSIVRLIKMNLERNSYEVEIAENTEQAFAKIHVRRPDLIITDVGMPDTNGFELTDAIRADASLAHLPIVMMYGSLEDRLGYTPEYLVNQRGANGLIRKPFDPRQLSATMERTLDRSTIAKRRRVIMDFSENYVRLHSPTEKRVLVVDDAPQIPPFVKSHLEPYGFQVETAYNGREALAKIKSSPPDALITDVMMPEMDGFQLIEAVRSDTAFAGLPIIVMRAIAADRGLTEEDVNFCLSRGADQVIGKPFNPRELVAYLHFMLFSPSAKDE